MATKKAVKMTDCGAEPMEDQTGPHKQWCPECSDDKASSEKCPVCGQDDNCGDCNHFGTPHYKS